MGIGHPLIDVGFSDPLGWQPERVRGSDLLAFADIEPIEVPVLPLEQHVAEKVHAYTRYFVSLRFEESRSKARVRSITSSILAVASTAGSVSSSEFT